MGVEVDDIKSCGNCGVVLDESTIRGNGVRQEQDYLPMKYFCPVCKKEIFFYD